MLEVNYTWFARLLMYSYICGRIHGITYRVAWFDRKNGNQICQIEMLYNCVKTLIAHFKNLIQWNCSVVLYLFWYPCTTTCHWNDHMIMLKFHWYMHVIPTSDCHSILNLLMYTYVHNTTYVYIYIYIYKNLKI